MNVVTISVSEPGRRVAERLPYPHHHGDPAAVLRRHWNDVDAFVLVLATGAAVRLLAPLLGDKATDPAVVAVDDAARFAVVLCGGHAGGGNALAAEVAGLLGAAPVVTTATDRLGQPALDDLPGWAAHGDLAAVTSAILADQPVELVATLGWPLPPALERRLAELAAVPGAPTARLEVTDRTTPSDASPSDRPTVLLRPPSLTLGVGTSTTATADELVAQVTAALDEAGLAPASVAAVATVDRRADHPAVVGLAGTFGVPVLTYGPDTLSALAVPTPSESVRAAVGTPSVAEAAALVGAGPGAELVVTKRVGAATTCAVARRSRPPGSVTVVGLGPGDPALRTPAATRALRHAEVVVGYAAYVDQVTDLLTPAQEVLRFPLGEELARAARALHEAAAGRRVALVSSGDPGVYAMASPLLELAGTPPFVGVPVSVVPGVTAGSAAAAVLGAPLGHDHVSVSLSDLHTPWEVIAERVTAAARADLVLVLYNPRSQRRTWQLEKVVGMLLEHRRADTPVGVVTDATRPGEHVVLTTLGELDTSGVTMTSCVVVGSSTTRIVEGRMVTPRGYPT
ncbi:MAG TPA: precorrin-3B C(17)-methyltransferase [Acidimicrobiales bacterium]|nr:precorrin-3B C(17)-methyltransferase [Acidimicrobiales bacterium]